MRLRIVISMVVVSCITASCTADDASQHDRLGPADAGAQEALGAGAAEKPLAVACETRTSRAGKCKASAEGVFAVKQELDVWWQDEVNATPLLDPGRGKITLYFRNEVSEFCDDGSSALGKVHPCGVRLPTIVTDATCKALQIEFPDELWERPGVPDYYTTGSASGFDPGDLLRVAQRTYLLGIKLADPTGSWPEPSETASFDCGRGSGAACFVDHDGDGEPGVTVRFAPRSGQYTVEDGAPYLCAAGKAFTYGPAPLSLVGAAFGTSGAELAYIGTRLSMGGEGAISANCESGEGTGDGADTVSSRVIDCALSADGSGERKRCSSAEAQFVDQNTPRFHVLDQGQAPPTAWLHPREQTKNGERDPEVTLLDRSPSKGSRLSVVRLGELGEHFDCQQVREADFPALR